MIITQTPLRISFLGGGTDYPEFFRAHGGATLGTSIDKYVYITLGRLTEFFEHRIRVSYSRTELCKTLDEIQHPSVRECLRFMGIQDSVEIGVLSDLPARTGLGSSSAFTVGLLHALHAFKGQLVSPPQLAAQAVHVERNLILERVGLQDQYTCALGGLVNFEFSGETDVKVIPMPAPREKRRLLEQRLLMFYTGQQRTAHEVLQEQMARTNSGAIAPYLVQMRDLVAQGVRVLVENRPLAEFAALLDRGWQLKRQFCPAISNPAIDAAYEAARNAGAGGGKLLGAGGGGFLLLYVEPDRQASVRAAIPALREVRFQFETYGSRLIFYQP